MASSVGLRRKARGLGFAFALTAFCSAAGLANAGPLSMTIGGQTSQPIGHYDFCKVHSAECSIRSPANAPESMTGQLLREISAVNLSVNTRVKPMSDMDNYGKDEWWAYPDNGFGDCEDYALEKQRELQAAGIAIANLLMTVVRKPDGEGHAVLTVRTDKGDFVLDNLSDKVRLWNQTGYRYLKRQASDNSGRWVSILGGDERLVSSVQ
ncbi:MULTISPECIES: transglutaminase-like cysteine peptidase [unclassified Mesorhizobium]|uniref:transglutaminase-like cysteine peptidase n=1 Tax=unclassified Mesorhizobium TaxID=325217 RepID=UPI00112A3214|nr:MULTISPECIES: transglutaminase-like cysteine peptidase [unclassified Mesorhizobium]MBZ9703753.1 transglutaminase-like cysteine peptidase [Mesorhizobium sp. CO1-1-3]MBZ9950443.1 transglutaminase-like cysteine peptidase [Mesorhizobium sp. BR1-1-11]TPI97940.1 transglutaminase [Mesorhizobium sp. B2-8-1]